LPLPPTVRFPILITGAVSLRLRSGRRWKYRRRALTN